MSKLLMSVYSISGILEGFSGILGYFNFSVGTVEHSNATVNDYSQLANEFCFEITVENFLLNKGLSEGKVAFNI